MTNVIYIIYNTFICGFILLLYLFIAQKNVKKYNVLRRKNFVWLLMFVHILFALMFYLYSINFASDATAYFKSASESSSWFSLFGTGADFMRFVIYPFTKLQISYFNTSLFLSVFGLIGFYNLYFLLIKRAHLDSSKIHWGASILFLLPTFHFYTSGISKDSLIFYFLTTLLVYFHLNKTNRWKYLLVFLFMFFIRSYVLIFLFAAIFIYAFLFSKIKITKRLYIIFGLIITLFILEPIISEKLNIELFSYESVDKFLSRVQSFGTNSRLGDSIIDGAEMTVLERMFTFSYVPLIYKSNSVLKHLTSIENLFLLLVFIQFLFSNYKLRILTKSSILIKICLLYSIITWFVLSFTLYNLGLSTRHKYMYIPYLYLVFFIHLKNKSYLKNANS